MQKISVVKIHFLLEDKTKQALIVKANTGLFFKPVTDTDKLAVTSEGRDIFHRDYFPLVQDPSSIFLSVTTLFP